MIVAITIVIAVIPKAKSEESPKPLPEPLIVHEEPIEKPMEIFAIETSGKPNGVEVLDDYVPPKPKPKPIPKNWDDEDVILLSKMLYGEAGAVKSQTEQAAVIWTACNYCDQFGTTLKEIAADRNHYHGYHKNNPVTPGLKALVIDVLQRWDREKAGETDVGRVLPKEYIYFGGHGGHNHFRIEYDVFDYWDWSLPSPYET